MKSPNADTEPTQSFASLHQEEEYLISNLMAEFETWLSGVAPRYTLEEVKEFMHRLIRDRVLIDTGNTWDAVQTIKKYLNSNYKFLPSEERSAPYIYCETQKKPQ